MVEGDDFVGDVAGDEENVSGTERLLFTANREDRTAFENDAHLLVRVGMNFDDGVRLQARNRDHELFGCTGLDADAGEDRRAILRGESPVAADFLCESARRAQLIV